MAERCAENAEGRIRAPSVPLRTVPAIKGLGPPQVVKTTREKTERHSRDTICQLCQSAPEMWSPFSKRAQVHVGAFLLGVQEVVGATPTCPTDGMRA